MVSRPRRLGGAVLACFVLVASSACSGSRPGPAALSTTAAPNPFATPGAPGLSAASGAPALTGRARTTLAIGDCFDVETFRAGAPIDLSKARPVPCAGPHQQEVYDVGSYPAPDRAPFPDEDTIDAYIQDRCVGAFSAYVGIDLQRSTLDFATVRPDRTSWDKGDRQVACVLHDADFALLTGSMRKAAR